MKKKIIAALLTIVLMLQLFPVTGFAAEADSFNLGAFDMETKTYKDATGTGEAIYRGISVGFSLEIAGGESITLPADGDGFTYNAALSSAYSKVINIPGGKTAAEIAAYVSQIRFNGSDAGQQVSVLLSDASINHSTFYWGGNQHFYQYVSGNTPWTTAHADAKNMEYNGRSGYLATVSSKAEDMFIRTVSNKIGWLGGTRLSVDTAAEGYSATDWKTWTFTPGSNAEYWYWACGPEAASGTAGGKFYTEAKFSADVDSASAAKGYYYNWDRGVEPNNSGGECCLSTLTLGFGCATKTYGYSWNDLTVNGNNGGSLYWAQGYFVEYGDESTGDSGGSGGVVSGSLTSDGSVSESFPAWATAAGLTSGSVATWQGRPLPSKLTLLTDVSLATPITLPDGVNITLDLGGHTITAPKGESAITSTGTVTLAIASSSGDGSILGADGVAAETGDGAPGTSAISLQDSSKITLGSGVTIRGGNGSDASSSGGNGGNGAYAIAGSNVSVTAESGASIIGGNGGDAFVSPGVGGTGGAAIEGYSLGGGTFTAGVNGATPPAITATSLPDGAVGEAYSYELSATGDAAISWSLNSGSLPDGLSISGDSIVGTPTKEGAFTFTVKAENSAGNDTQELTITIADSLLATPIGLAWDTALPANVSWSAVSNAASYSVQLYKDGIAMGGPVSAIDLRCDFSSLITQGGTYTFKVMAVGTHPTYGNSAWSSASAGQSAYSISFFSYSGTGSMPSEIAFSGFPFTLPDCGFTAPSGQRFKQWQIYDYTGTVYLKAGETHTFTSGNTAYAQWEAIPTYDVSVAVNKDSAPYTGKTVKLKQGEDVEYTLTGNGTVYTGVVPAGTYAIYLDGEATGASVTVTGAGGSATLDYYTVSFEADGGKPAPEACILLSGSKITKPAGMIKESEPNMGCKDWYKTAALEGNAWNFATDTVAGTMTLYPKWEKLHIHSVSVNCSETEGTQKLFTEMDASFTGGTLEAGNYYLTRDITLSNTILVRGDVNLCLNGHTLKQPDAQNRRVITVESGTLSLCDCAAVSGMITNGRGQGGGIYVKSGAVFAMLGGRIYKNSSADKGGGVYVQSGAAFTMEGGEISENTSGDYYSDAYGAGVYVEGSATFTMKGGKISKNSMGAEDTEAYGGGVYVTNGASFSMEGGEISENVIGTDGATAYGGGVCVANSASFTMKNGKISGNTSGSIHAQAGYGGGVYLENSASFTMEDGTISENKSSIDGGGVYVTGAAATFTMKDGTISENKSSIDGGGVYVENSANFTMEDGTISGNESGVYSPFGGSGGGVYVKNAAFTMKAGEISGNESGCGSPSGASGGGVYVESGANFTMENGSISGNSSSGEPHSDEGFGGGVFAQGSVTLSGNAVIRDNYRNGTLVGGVYTKGDYGSLDNLYLNSSTTVSIAEGGLTAGAHIGVITGTAPTEGTPISITGNNSADYHSFFVSDRSGYLLFNSGTGAAQVVKLRAISTDTTLSALSYAVDGGSAVSVPGFISANRSVTVMLPSDTAADAKITLTGTCTDSMARITENNGVTLSNSRGAATIKVTAESGAIGTYTVTFITRTHAPVFSDDEDTLTSMTDAAASFTLAQVPEPGTVFKIYDAETCVVSSGTASFSGQTLSVELDSIPSADRSYYISMKVPGRLESMCTPVTVNAYITYTVSYQPNGGSGSIADATAVRWTEFTLPGCTFTPPIGKHFKEWAIGSIDGTKVKAADGYTFTGNTEVFAIWELTDFSVSYPDGQHGSITGSATANYDTEYADTLVPATGYSLPDSITMTMDGLPFTEFTYDNATGAITIAANKIAGDLVIRGECTPIEYTVTYDTNGGSTITAGSYDIEDTSFILPTAPTKVNYTFAGWKVTAGAAGGSGFALNDAFSGTSRAILRSYGNVTLTAQWTEDIYTVTYDANGGTGTMSNGTAAHGTAFALPACSFTAPAGKQFKEWAIGSTTGTKVAEGGTHSFTADTTVYAVWEDSPSDPTGYHIIDGQNGEWTKSGNGDLGFTADGDYSRFTGVSVDGTAISSDKYTSKSGSTIVTLKASYLKMLSVGRHTLRINFTDGYAETHFTIKAATNPDNPPTGDNARPWLWLGIALLAGAGVAASLVLGRKNRQNR